MSSNTENIEAKLCAYVDGDLDEQGKLEIEKHLQANPQHRLLLEELKQTKDMMQALPREVAPPELAERLYERFVERVRASGIEVATGRFREHMQVSLVNDGPVTLWIDTAES